MFNLLHQDFREVRRVPSQGLKAISEPPFRAYKDFIARTLNPQHFGEVSLDWETANLSHEKWFSYQCIRHNNQFTGKISFAKALTYLVGGIKGGGKSAIVGNMQAFFPKWIGAYGEADDEVLADLRAWEYAKKVGGEMEGRIGRMQRGLIIGAPGASVNSSYDYITYDKLTLNDVYNHDVIVCPQRIYPTMGSFFQGTERIVDVLKERPFADDMWYFKILEAANVIYSRITLKKMKVDQAKAHLIWMMRGMRHYGISLGLDTQYLTSIDREMRINSDYFILKNMGSDQLSKDIAWMYRYVSPIGFMSLYSNEFVCKDKHGGVYVGWFKLPPWHKEPKENIYETMGIKPDFNPEQLKEDLNNTNAEDVDLLLHMEIVNTYTKMQPPSLKGCVRELTLKGTPHDRDTVKRHIAMHYQAKNCPCWKNQSHEALSLQA